MDMIPRNAHSAFLCTTQQFQELCLKHPQTHTQLLPLSPSFGVSLPDAPDRAALELLEAGVGWCQCPHGSVPQVSVSLLGGLAAAGDLPKPHTSQLPHCPSQDVTRLV